MSRSYIARAQLPVGGAARYVRYEKAFAGVSKHRTGKASLHIEVVGTPTNYSCHLFIYTTRKPSGRDQFSPSFFVPSKFLRFFL